MTGMVRNANFESSSVRLELEAPPDLSLAPTPDPDEGDWGAEFDRWSGSGRWVCEGGMCCCWYTEFCVRVCGVQLWVLLAGYLRFARKPR